MMALAALAMGDAAACMAANAMAAARGDGLGFQWFSSAAYDRLCSEMQAREKSDAPAAPDTKGDAK